MALRYTIDSGKSCVLIAGDGRLSMPEMIAIVDDVAADPMFRSDFIVIFDIRNGDYTAELADGDMFVAALNRRQQAFRNRFALVVPAPIQVVASLFCLLAQVGGVDRIRSFTDIEEARRWCGLSG